jgi:hypothetical protein
MVVNTKPPPPPLPQRRPLPGEFAPLGTPPESAYTIEGALAVCDACGATTACERSLYGLAHAETDHCCLTGCDGSMRIDEADTCACGLRASHGGPCRPPPTAAPGPGRIGSR